MVIVFNSSSTLLISSVRLIFNSAYEVGCLNKKQTAMKKIIFLGAALLAVAVSASAQEILHVEVTNIKNTNGTVRVGLFDTDDNFLKKAVAGQTVKAKGEKVEITFKNIPPGEYAISVIHDENENGELDSNVFGIPKEGFGFGNDAMGTFGPPSFDKAKVKVDRQSQKQVIKMRYF